MTNEDAFKTFEAFSANPAVTYREEPSGLSSLWPRMATRSIASPKVWMDAYLAAFAIAGGLTMVTLDADFNAFNRQGLDLVLIDIP